ncbi:glycogen synthase, partial [bacterium]
VSVIARIDKQKGFDLIKDTFEEMMNLDIQFVLLGQGEKEYHNFFTEMMKKYKNKVSINLTYDNELAHKIYAGSDMFLMPSHFEPCGLTQLISLTYGTIPVITPVGGLIDTVVKYDQDKDTGSGFVLDNYSKVSLIASLEQAVSLYKNKKKWGKLIKRAMASNFSWDKSAKEYIDIYKKARAKKTD